MRTRLLIAGVSLAFAAALYAGTTGTTGLHMPQGDEATRPNGDFVSDNDAGALNTFYRYFIEVPPGIDRLQIQLFDADIGLGGGTEDTAGRDRTRNGNGTTFSTTATYRLFDPNGTAQPTRFTTGDDNGPAGSDNAWIDFYNATGNDVMDTFASNVYTRNDGNNNWATNWVETDAGGGGAGGATGGSIQVTGGELRLQDVNNGSPNIYREVDLLGTPGLNMGMAFLTFDYRTSGNLDNSDNVLVQVSGNGGGSYTTLETFSNDSSGSRSYDISAFIANNTRIRFSIPDGDLNAANQFFYIDDVRISDGPVTAGHWELQIDQTAGGIDINALGIRAHDGDAGSGGTELNIYADSMVSLGVNPPTSGSSTRNFTLYPWVTSGCTCSQNDFDVDYSVDQGNTGSVDFTSRSGAYTRSFAASDLSANNVWNHNDITGWTNDNASADYGIWKMDDAITTYVNENGINGNYETKYVANYRQLATDPTINPLVVGGNPAAFRLYLPNDAGGAPAKPYLEQFVTQIGGPHTPALPVSTPTNFSISIRVTNPAAHAITFNGSNLVNATIPTGTAGNNAVYAGGATASQGAGTITAPTVGTAGNITWNPGSLAAGGVATLSYNVTVRATAGSRIVVTGAVGSGTGTRAQFIDETGNTTQARARYTLGEICPIAVTQGLATAAVLSKFDLDVHGGATTVEWMTASEAGTAGFNVYRANGDRVNARLIPASLKPQGGKYQLVDPVNSDPGALYYVEEVNASGEARRFGPFNHFQGIDREKKDEERRASRRFMPEAAGSWDIESDAAKRETPVAVMVGVRSTGVVRVPFADLATALQTTASAVEKAASKGTVSVTSNGTPIAWTTDATAILFFGEKTTSIYSNDRVYRIELATGVKMQTVPVTGAAASVSSFTASQDLESDSFFATILPLDPQGDFWFWEAFISGDPTYGRKTFNVDVPAMASASGATMSVRLQGAFKDTTHRAKISLNGVPIGETTWQSFDAKTAKLSVPAALLRDGSNEIVVEGVLEGGASTDIFYVDGFTIGYQRFARPDGGQVEVRRAGPVGAGPFTSAPLVLDITNRNRPSVLQGASFNGSIASLNTPPSTGALFFAQTFVAPSFLRGSNAAKLKNTPPADWVIVAPQGFRSAAESLASLRGREGLRTLVADLDQIYDEFAGGNQTPLAIRDFFLSLLSGNKPPRYFVLAGVGSVDYRGIQLAPGPLPPMMTSTPDGIYAADSLFVDRNNDRLPDAAIGRIPVSTPAELKSYVAKLEANSRVIDSQQPLVFSADNVDRGADFRHASVLAEAPLTARPVTHIYLDELGGDVARTQLLNAWHGGSPLVSWVGHGGLDQLSNAGILSSYDAPSLTSLGPLPVFVAMTCTINRFENGYIDSLGTALTKEAGAGAVAVWSASGLSNHSQASDVQRTFMRLAAETPGVRIGDLVVQALAPFRNDSSSVYLLLGDPAIRLDLPSEVRNGGNKPTSRE
jgi:peptidase C25-like protein